MLEDLNAWMDKKGYGSLDAFRGKMSKKNSKDLWVYERAQYVKLLFESDKIITEAP
jgi:dihydroorotate dehydrogenase (fumarate)